MPSGDDPDLNHNTTPPREQLLDRSNDDHCAKGVVQAIYDQLGGLAKQSSSIADKDFKEIINVLQEEIDHALGNGLITDKVHAISTVDLEQQANVHHGHSAKTGKLQPEQIKPNQNYWQRTATKSDAGLNTKTFNKWLPRQRFIISSNSDSVIKNSAKSLAIENSVPAENCFVSRRDGENHAKFGTELREGSQQLSHLTLADRLDLVGHGNSNHFEGNTAREVAQSLKSVGLKEVGVLKFKSCNPGYKNFLEDVRDQLQEAGIKCGYVSGATGYYASLSHPVSLFGKKFNVGPGNYVSTNVGNNIHLSKFWFALKGATLVSWVVDKEVFHIKTVPGSENVSFRKTRYMRR